MRSMSEYRPRDPTTSPLPPEPGGTKGGLMWRVGEKSESCGGSAGASPVPPAAREARWHTGCIPRRHDERSEAENRACEERADLVGPRLVEGCGAAEVSAALLQRPSRCLHRRGGHRGADG